MQEILNPDFEMRDRFAWVARSDFCSARDAEFDFGAGGVGILFLDEGYVGRVGEGAEGCCCCCQRGEGGAHFAIFVSRVDLFFFSLSLLLI
jgi:hypothetical protein